MFISGLARGRLGTSGLCEVVPLFPIWSSQDNHFLEYYCADFSQKFTKLSPILSINLVYLLYYYYNFTIFLYFLPHFLYFVSQATQQCSIRALNIILTFSSHFSVSPVPTCSVYRIISQRNLQNYVYNKYQKYIMI